MQRAIKSEQRQVRQIHVIVDSSAAITGLDSNKVTGANTGTGVKTLTLDSAFAASDMVVQATPASADTIAAISVTNSSTIVISTFDATDGTTAKDAIVHVTITGSDVQDRY